VEYVIRFLAGGAVVSILAAFADVIRPKSMAGLFGASPSIALVTLGLAFYSEGSGYALIEGRSMIFGALALAAYSYLVCIFLLRTEVSALTATTALLPAWLSVAVLLQLMFVGWS
jgi:uncharacterized membrane protein (GlpM family)